MKRIILLTVLTSSFITVTTHAFTKQCDIKTVYADKAGYEYIELDRNAFAQKLQQRRESGINFAAITQAKNLQREFGVIPKATPLYTNNSLNNFAQKLLGHEIKIYLKDETVNPTGSFKDRMPINFYKTMSKKIQQSKYKNDNLKVIAVSTGNHGRAVAYAANRANDYISKKGLKHKFDIYSEITMSTAALPHKKSAIAKLGAKIRDHYPHQQKPIKTYDEAENFVTHEAKADPEHTLLLMHADKHAVNGYAVIADEMIQQAKDIGINFEKTNSGEALMLVPLGSGGLLSGTEEISARYPNVHSIGVTASPADLTYQSLKTCSLVRDTQPYNGPLIVDGVMATPEKFSLQRISEIANEVVLVRQEDAIYASALLKKKGINVEPTSGLPLAALLLGINDHYKNAHYAFIVLTGRNISSDMEQKITLLSNQDETVVFEYFKQRRNEIKNSLSKSGMI